MDNQKSISIQLFTTLDEVGASETVRRTHQHTAAVIEVIRTITWENRQGKLSRDYICGSRYEGSVTPELASDVDVIGCYNVIPVVLDPRLTKHGGVHLMVKYVWTYPGYVKLQWVLDEQPLTQENGIIWEDTTFDMVGRLCEEHINAKNMQGPASPSFDKRGKHYLDGVFAVKCDSIPDFTNEWLHRHRRHGWPTPQQLETMSTMGCMMVSIGYWKSPEHQTEWRMSFSLQERYLMASLNPTQHKVYILLKMIKKTILEKAIESESLSSYQCKTCIFYAVERTHAAFWCPENLIQCTQYCLWILRQWVIGKFCPNYFIKDQNLFSKESFKAIRDKLKTAIEALIQKKHRFVYELESDGINIMMMGLGRMVKSQADRKKWKYILGLNLKLSRTVFQDYLVNMHVFNDPLLTLGILQSRDSIPDFTAKQTMITMTYIQPWLHLHIAKTLAAHASNADSLQSANFLYSRSGEHFRCAFGTDVSSVRFAQASILYKRGKYEECSILLQEIQKDLSNMVLSICHCQSRSVIHHRNQNQLPDLLSRVSNMSDMMILQNHIAYCVVFSRSESRITPEALQYEMYRSLDTETDSRNEIGDFWFDFAVTDAWIFLYFMQYLVYSALEMDVSKQEAVQNLEKEIDKCNTSFDKSGDRILAHKDTAYNILGWIHQQEKSLDSARQCFLESLKVQPKHNAAKFHISEMDL